MAGEKPLYVRIDSGLKKRIEDQSKRLNISQSALAKMALVHFLETEEKLQADRRA